MELNARERNGFIALRDREQDPAVLVAVAPLIMLERSKDSTGQTTGSCGLGVAQPYPGAVSLDAKNCADNARAAQSDPCSSYKLVSLDLDAHCIHTCAVLLSAAHCHDCQTHGAKSGRPTLGHSIPVMTSRHSQVPGVCVNTS